MSAATAFSKDEYFDILEKSEVKLEYRAGEIYTRWGEPIEYRDGQLVTAETGFPVFPPNLDVMAMSGAQPAHNLIAMNLAGKFFECLREQGCSIHSSDQSVYIEACDQGTFPNLTIVCEEPNYVKSKQGLDALTNPAIVIEILSKSTEHYDRVEKFECCRTLESLQEYVLVSTKRKEIQVFSKKQPREWTLQIYDEENPTIRIGNCEAELSEIYWRVIFETA